MDSCPFQQHFKVSLNLPILWMDYSTTEFFKVIFYIQFLKFYFISNSHCLIKHVFLVNLRSKKISELVTLNKVKLSCVFFCKFINWSFINKLFLKMNCRCEFVNISTFLGGSCIFFKYLNVSSWLNYRNLWTIIFDKRVVIVIVTISWDSNCNYFAIDMFCSKIN